MLTCPLCHHPSQLFYEEIFYKCSFCLSVFRSPESHMSKKAEKARYDTHNNDIFDIGYQKFVSPICSRVEKEFDINAKGLDYGAGPGPVISHLLSKKGYNITLYDPYYHPDDTVLKESYNFIVCCEVIEHFYNPEEEFKKLFSLLSGGGRLYLMTEIFYEGEDFGSWYYKNDPTHVFFYHLKAFDYIATRFSVKVIEIDTRCIMFEKI